MANSSTPRQPIAMITLSLILIGGLLLIGVVLINNFSGNTPAATPTARATNTPDVAAGASVIPINPPQTLTDFAAIDTNGESTSLSDLRGKWAMVYFGYANCPDFCPLTMAQFVQIKAMLGARADEFDFVMVSIDPERDTPEIIRTYLNNFDSTFVGMLVDPQTLVPIENEYGLTINVPEAGTLVPHSMPGMENAAALDGGYLIDHTTYSYLIDPDGNLRVIFSFNTSAQTMFDEIMRTLS